MSHGYVYVLLNPSMPGLLKIGRTERDPTDRVSELSAATGVATPFLLLYKKQFTNCIAAEEFVHSQFEKLGRRVANNREFFRIDPSEVIDLISKIPSDLFKQILDTSIHSLSVAIEDDKDLDDNAEDEDHPKTLLDSLLDEAHSEESTGASVLYERATAIGGPEIYIVAGDRFYNDDDNERLALQYYRKAADEGVYYGYAKMASIYDNIGRYADEDRCWRKFIEHFACDKNPEKLRTDFGHPIFNEPMVLFFTRTYFIGRWHADGQDMRDVAREMLKEDYWDTEEKKEWQRYLDRSPVNDWLILKIKDDLLHVLNELDAQDRRVHLPGLEELRDYLMELTPGDV